MAEISAKDVKALRETTNAGMMDCKKALQESNGDMKAAEEWLRKKGLSEAGRKGSRVAAEGAVISYVHPGSKLAVIVEVNCESDFVARGEDFQNFARDVAMQIAAANPLWVRREEANPEAVEKERAILKAQVVESGKPANIADKIVEGKINKWYSDVVLLEQPWVKEPKMTIEELRASMVQKTGENVSIRRFTRYVLGEGIEKKVSDLAAEVAKMTAGA
jgi:elongation factor Ts